MRADDQHLPGGWCLTDIGSLGNYLNGRGFKKGEWSEDGRPIIRIQNLTGSSEKFNFFEGQVDTKHEVEPGDLLMGTSKNRVLAGIKLHGKAAKRGGTK